MASTRGEAPLFCLSLSLALSQCRCVSVLWCGVLMCAFSGACASFLGGARSIPVKEPFSDATLCCRSNKHRLATTFLHKGSSWHVFSCRVAQLPQQIVYSMVPPEDCIHTHIQPTQLLIPIGPHNRHNSFPFNTRRRKREEEEMRQKEARNPPKRRRDGNVVADTQDPEHVEANTARYVAVNS